METVPTASKISTEREKENVSEIWRRHICVIKKFTFKLRIQGPGLLLLHSTPDEHLSSEVDNLVDGDCAKAHHVNVQVKCVRACMHACGCWTPFCIRAISLINWTTSQICVSNGWVFPQSHVESAQHSVWQNKTPFNYRYAPSQRTQHIFVLSEIHSHGLGWIKLLF